MDKPIRWGILGTGSIAKQFARALDALPDAQLVAVGSRSVEGAAAFAEHFPVDRQHASYAALAQDPAVDVVYVATPHPLHKENTLLCLANGKAVLSEKPFAINLAETRAMVDAARRAKLFLMEAMWTRYIPVVARVREWLAQGAIGEVRMLMADFGFRAGWSEESRLLNPELGGGALLDVGIYTLSLASMVLRGAPAQITGLAHRGATGVDEQNAAILRYENGALAILASAVRTNTPHEARIQGTDGSIRIHAPFWKATTATLSISGKEETVCTMPHLCNGYEYEAMEVARCLRAGKLESDTMPLDETCAIMDTMDKIRAQWGLKYPME